MFYDYSEFSVTCANAIKGMAIMHNTIHHVNKENFSSLHKQRD